jgi:hypothetical protein
MGRFDGQPEVPVLRLERVRQGIVEAATRATDEAMQEYFGPGGAGYKQIIQQVGLTIFRLPILAGVLVALVGAALIIVAAALANDGKL